ncbi:unnamed protein product [Gulo gulo]|uniref:Uncharacterized protein n=1 Tax=Gulo gulo TaxID=48420 RepID=A0A9X9PVA1_GULGU|nr:unnamed protein product [Gulo gulo]
MPRRKKKVADLKPRFTGLQPTRRACGPSYSRWGRISR